MENKLELNPQNILGMISTSFSGDVTDGDRKIA